MGVDCSTPGPFRWKLCASERSLTEMSYVPGASCVIAFPFASRSEITNASFVPPTATSFGLSAWATADGNGFRVVGRGDRRWKHERCEQRDESDPSCHDRTVREPPRFGFRAGPAL